MIAIFIILAWSLTMISGLVVITGIAISFAGLSVIDEITTNTGSTNILVKLFTFFTKQPYTTFAGDNSPILLNTNSINNLTWTTILTGAIMLLIAISLIGVTIFELIRVKKRQKISKPFVRIYLLSLAVLFLLLAQYYLIISAALLFLAVIFIEFGLLDSEAVNNYAEERNLIAIYKEEKKFEKEVSKEGKLIGNVDSAQINQKESHVVDENQKIIDNSALPYNSNIKNEIAFKKWKNKKLKIEDKKQDLLRKTENLSETKLEKLIIKLNKEIEHINIQGYKLNIPNDYLIKYVDLELLKEEKLNSIKENDEYLIKVPEEQTEDLNLNQNNELNDEASIIEIKNETLSEDNFDNTLELNNDLDQSSLDIIENNQIQDQNMDIKLNEQEANEKINDEITIAKKDEIYNDFNFDQQDFSNKVLRNDFNNLESNKKTIELNSDNDKELIEEQNQNIEKDFTSDNISIIDEVKVQEDILKIEKRLSNLENLINELIKSNQKEEIYSDFEKISDKLETINQAILKINNNSNPINIIDSITRRYKYNQNNS